MASATIPVPHPGAAINQAILNDLFTRGVFNGMQVFASLVEHGTTNGFPSYKRYPEGASKKPKYFTSYSPIGVFIDGSLPLSKPVNFVPPPSFSDPSFSIYSPGAARFYLDRCMAEDEQFLVMGIPRLVILPYEDHGKMNFDLDDGKDPSTLQPRLITNAEQAWPLGTIFPDPTGPIEREVETETGKRLVKFRASFPPNHALKYNLKTGLPEIFNFEEYNRAFPLETIVRVKGSGSSTGSGSIQPKAGINLRASIFPLILQPTLTDADFNKGVINLLEVK